MFSAFARSLHTQTLKGLLSFLVDPRREVIARNFLAGFLCGTGDLCFRRIEISSVNCFVGARRFSANSMRSRVEKRMQRESGKTLREMRRAKKLRKKLMTDEERLIYNLRRAKKKVALLLQKLKKYELPELPAPRHDPELFTPEQLQAYKKIGFRNRNYVPVGVRGVFGGVVQNMHMHWKFHETVQVACDNFPKEKIKEMGIMLARLSGGIVVNIHNSKTIIMFRGRNYRQPKVLIPINTLTKRKALFKARFEQALESQKLNIKKIEQELRRKGVNPDDPVAMASIQRVASTFFNAIDKNEGSPYVFRESTKSQLEARGLPKDQDAGDDSDQEELDRFIAEIEDAADKEWAEEEAAEKEELVRIRYWNREDFAGGRFQRSEVNGREGSGYGVRDRTTNRDKEEDEGEVDDDQDDDDDDDDSREVDFGSDVDADYGEAIHEFSGRGSRRSEFVRGNSSKVIEGRKDESRGRRRRRKDVLSDLQDLGSGSGSEEDGDDVIDSSASDLRYKSSSDEEEY